MSGDAFPRLVVLDLDACLWDPEVHLLDGKPSTPVHGDLGNGMRGVVGASNGTQTVTLHPGGLEALRQLRTMPHVKVAAASSSLIPEYSYGCLNLLEVEPGVTAMSCFHYHQIGREGKLSKRKTDHFALLREESGVEYGDMLFFDDCGWGDHVADLRDTFGVCGWRTPKGMQVSDWVEGLKHYAAEKKKGGE